MSQTQMTPGSAGSGQATRGNKYLTLVLLLLVAAGFFVATVTNVFF